MTQEYFLKLAEFSFPKLIKFETEFVSMTACFILAFCSYLADPA